MNTKQLTKATMPCPQWSDHGGRGHRCQLPHHGGQHVDETGMAWGRKRHRGRPDIYPPPARLGLTETRAWTMPTDDFALLPSCWRDRADRRGRIEQVRAIWAMDSRTCTPDLRAYVLRYRRMHPTVYGGGRLP